MYLTSGTTIMRGFLERGMHVFTGPIGKQVGFAVREVDPCTVATPVANVFWPAVQLPVGQAVLAFVSCSCHGKARPG